MFFTTPPYLLDAGAMPAHRVAGWEASQVPKQPQMQAHAHTHGPEQTRTQRTYAHQCSRGTTLAVPVGQAMSVLVGSSLSYPLRSIPSGRPGINGLEHSCTNKR
eukprot:SAG11_NODE_1304_length_5250_cov_5.457581_2_plen_104_part_00